MSTPDYRSMQGWWNARVTAGATLEDRRALLAECPEGFRPEAESHVRTVFALRAAAPKRKAKAMTGARA